MIMKMVLKICVLFLLSCSIAGCAKDEVETTGSVYGIITNADNGEPVSGVIISLNPGGKSASTGSDGRYEFLNLEPEQYTVQAMCSGYKSNTKRITVVAGEIASGDMLLTKGADQFKLEPQNLVFTKGQRESSFKIINLSTSGTIEWRISGKSPWITVVSASSGSIAKDKQAIVNISIGSEVTAGTSGYIKIEAGGDEQQVFVTVSNEEGSNPDDGGSDSGVSGTVTSCDGRILVKMTAFRMSGSTAILEYTLQNNGEDIANLDLEKYNCGVYDNLGTGYDVSYQTKVYYELGSQKAFDGWSRLRLPFPNGTTLKGLVKIMNVPAGATEFTNISIGFATYASTWKLDNEKVIFKNVKIKR